MCVLICAMIIASVGLNVGLTAVIILLSPVKEPTGELLARTSPGLFDVIIAVAGGAAGIIARRAAARSTISFPASPSPPP